MDPRSLLAVTALVVGTLLSASVLVTATQGRGLDADTTTVIGAAAVALVAGALGVVIGVRRKKKNDDDE